MSTWPSHLNADQFFLRDRLKEGFGDGTALLLDDRQVTYAGVDARANEIAFALLELGVERGDRVLIVLGDGLDFVASIFAVLRIGAVVVMLNPGMNPEAMRVIVNKSRARAVVVGPDHRKSYESSLHDWVPDVVDPSSIGGGGASVETVQTLPMDPAFWIFSGGTTGAPKAVVQTHRSLVNTTRLYGQGVLGLSSQDITMAVPKLYFGYATGSNLLFPFSVGASAVLFDEHPTPDALFSRISRHRPTVLVNVPTAINQMLSHDSAGSADLSSLRLATSAGEPLPDSMYHRWVETFDVPLLDGLGTAEMWHIFISNTVSDVRPGTLGRVVPGFEVKACDEIGDEVPVGDVGRLWVRGDSLGLGYWEMPGETEEAFRGDWFVGGDLISIDADGYVTHSGRADDAIKVKGKWFRPQEVESALLANDSVGECAVVAVADGAGLASPVAFVRASGPVTEGELSEWLADRLESYKRPRQIHFVDQLPQTHLGKVDRAALKRAAG